MNNEVFENRRLLLKNRWKEIEKYNSSYDERAPKETSSAS